MAAMAAMARREDADSDSDSVSVRSDNGVDAANTAPAASSPQAQAQAQAPAAGPTLRKLKLHEREQQEIKTLEARIASETPARGSQLAEIASFEGFACSRATLRGLSRAGFTAPTRIQCGAVPHALAGRDILAAAKTGSGKTLAFLIPVLERLYRARWDVEDGLGAMVISPTRELALQIFEVLRAIGKTHSFSAGLVIGGKNFQEEQYRIVRMNILVCTPGRVLQHFEQTPDFDPTNLQALVLDEADRILDMGFSAQLHSILSYLPKDRQTLLFSATQTKSIKDLAALSLNEPEYIAVHEHSASATPQGLMQSYVECDASTKLDVLFSFLKTHLKHKTIVFLATCRQVRFVYAAFCKLQPGVPLYALHGKYKQGKRVEIYYQFLNKPAAVLFATDIAARGLDFPNVDWVFQLDCPEDAPNYIHRVGRTARYNQQGKALLCLLPSERPGMTKCLADAKIPIKELKLNPTKRQSCKNKLTSIVAANKDIKALAQKALMSYVRSVFLMPMKDVFDASALPLETLAQSFGLPTAPRMTFLEKLEASASAQSQEQLRAQLRGKKNVNHKLMQLKEKIKAEKARKKLARELAARGIEHTTADLDAALSKKGKEEDAEEDEDDDEDEGDDLMVVKRRHDWGNDDVETPSEIAPDVIGEAARHKRKKLKIRVDEEVNLTKVVFDDEGNSVSMMERLAARPVDSSEHFDDVEGKSEAYTASVASRLKEREDEDRRVEKERVRAKHLKKRMKRKKEQDDSDASGDDEENGETVVTIGGASDEDEEMASGDDTETGSSEGDYEDDEDMDENDNKSKRKVDRALVALQEEMALRLLQAR